MGHNAARARPGTARGRDGRRRQDADVCGIETGPPWVRRTALLCPRRRRFGLLGGGRPGCRASAPRGATEPSSARRSRAPWRIPPPSTRRSENCSPHSNVGVEPTTPVRGPDFESGTSAIFVALETGRTGSTQRSQQTSSRHIPSKSAAGSRVHLVPRSPWRQDQTGRTVLRLTPSDQAHTMVEFGLRPPRGSENGCAARLVRATSSWVSESLGCLNFLEDASRSATCLGQKNRQVMTCFGVTGVEREDVSKCRFSRQKITSILEQYVAQDDPRS